jgi:predicted PurR-regulated permease PerM
MASPSSDLEHREFLDRAMETSIRIGAVALVAAWCFQITRPFIIPAVWGVIIATTCYPPYVRLRRALGERGRLAAALLTIAGLLLLVVPLVTFAGSLVDSGQWLYDSLEDGTLEIPPPPAGIASWPLIGEPLDRFWSLANTNLEAALKEVGPQLASWGGTLLSAGANAGLGALQFLLSIVIAGVLLAAADPAQQGARRFSHRLVGARGDELADMAASTVRSVATGILGVAVIQSVLAGLGMFVFGIPHASLWALLVLLLAVVQLPPFLVLIPIMFYAFSVKSTASAVVFTIWMVIAGGSDNVLKPMLLGRGSNVPTVIIFVGAIGGFIASGFVGLFVGAVVLALGYELFRVWLDQSETEASAATEETG